MRAVGLDLGERRIGVAVSDGAGRLAVGHEVLRRGGDRASDHAAVAAVVAETGAGCVVVGLPVSMDGREGPAAQRVREEVGALRRTLSVPVEVVDERLTTVTASRALAAAGVGERGKRGVIDQVAAAVILQAWLDTNRPKEALP